MKYMIYISKQGKQIVFDDFVDNTKEYNSYYACMCENCLNKYKDILENKIDDGKNAMGTCSVNECFNEADCYIDFGVEEIKIL